VPAGDDFMTTLASTADLAAGRYVVSAKVVVARSLHRSRAALPYGTISSNGSGNVLVSTLALENDNTADVAISGGKAVLRRDGPVAFDARNIKITAIQVESLPS
jgi:hypothetical protein